VGACGGGEIGGVHSDRGQIETAVQRGFALEGHRGLVHPELRQARHRRFVRMTVVGQHPADAVRIDVAANVDPPVVACPPFVPLPESAKTASASAYCTGWFALNANSQSPPHSTFPSGRSGRATLRAINSAAPPFPSEWPAVLLPCHQSAKAIDRILRLEFTSNSGFECYASSSSAWEPDRHRALGTDT
jgi:hypothetical protein